MKKEINSKSRRKWIMGGLAAFASVALLTTGFAIWTVGVTQEEKKENVTVKVNTAVNSSITFDAKISEAELGLGENQVWDTSHFAKDDMKGSDGQDSTYVKEDLEISFTSINVNVGMSVAAKKNLTGIELSILTKAEVAATTPDTSDDGNFADNLVASTANKLPKNKRADKAEGWTYFDLAKTTLSVNQTNTDGNKADQDGYKAYEVPADDLKINFKWGSFFDGKSPCEYYNSLFDDDAAKNVNNSEYRTAANAQAIVGELTAMHKQLDTKKIVLNMKLVFETVGA